MGRQDRCLVGHQVKSQAGRIAAPGSLQSVLQRQQELDPAGAAADNANAHRRLAVGNFLRQGIEPGEEPVDRLGRHGIFPRARARRPFSASIRY